MTEGVARPVPTDAFGGARLGYVQGLRGLSILAVVLYHAGGVLPRGYAGVDTFFVLSGFVITRMVWQRRELTGRVSASWFFARRIRRLLPAATVALLVTAAASALVLSPFGTMQLTAQLGRWTSVFLANHGAYAVAPDYFGTRADEVPLVHMWSLAVEEQFYIGFFVVLAFGVGRRRGRLLGWVSAALAVASLALFLRTAGGAPLPGYPAADRAAFYLAPLRGWEFLAGSLVFLLFRARRPAQTWSVVGQLAGLAAWCWFVLTPDPGPPMGPWLMVPVAATALLLAGHGGPGRGALEHPGLLRLGDLSYSWYLWPWALLVLSRGWFGPSASTRWVAVTAALGVAWASYRWVEQPWRRAAPGSRFPWRLLATAVAAPTLAFAGLAVVADRVSAEPNAVRLQQDTARPLRTSAGCSSGQPIERLAACTIGAERPGPPIYLVGDSNAGMYADGLDLAAQRLNRPLVLATQASCPFVDVRVNKSGRDDEVCRRRNAHVRAWLAGAPRGTVVIAAANTWISAGRVALADPVGAGGWDWTPEGKARLWTAGVTRSLGWLGAGGHQVLVIATVPHPGGTDETGEAAWGLTRCPAALVVWHPDGCQLSVERTAQQTSQAAELAAEAAAVHQAGVRTLDLWTELCPAGRCDTARAAGPAYRDSNHLTVSQSRRLAPLLQAALAAS